MTRSFSVKTRARILLWLAASGCWSLPAWALTDSDKEAIRLLSNEAAQDFNQRHFEEARGKFQRAYEIARVPRLAVWLARTEESLGHLVGAYELYRQALSLQANELWKGDLQQQAQRDAQRELEALAPRIAQLTISLEGAQTNEVTVAVDGVPVPSALLGVDRLIDTGEHKVVGKRAGEVVQESVQVAERDKKQVVLRFSMLHGGETATKGVPLAPGSAPPKSALRAGTAPAQPGQATQSSGVDPVPVDTVNKGRSNVQRTAGWVGVGLGAAGLSLGTVTGIYLAAKHGDLDRKCPDNNNCDPKYESEVNTYQAMRTLSTVGFVVGGISAAAGITLLLTTPKHESNFNVSLWLTPQLAGVRGNF